MTTDTSAAENAASDTAAITTAPETTETEPEAAAENREMQGSLTAPNNNAPAAKGETWLTREDYNNLSEAEFDKQYDKIARQIELEKAGKLPRMLTL